MGGRADWVGLRERGSLREEKLGVGGRAVGGVVEGSNGLLSFARKRSRRALTGLGYRSGRCKNGVDDFDFNDALFSARGEVCL